MNIVLKWNFKTLISDLPRLLLTICGIAVTYAIIVGMGLSLASSVAATGSMNEGLANYAVRIVTPIIQASFAATIFVLFAVMLAERKNQIFIMRTVGCTTRQLLWGLLAESLAMDTAGMLPGVAKWIINTFHLPWAATGQTQAIVLLLAAALLWRVNSWLTNMLFAAYVFIAEYKRIVPIRWYRKLWYIFTFPIFDLIGQLSMIIALFSHVEWKPIPHNADVKLDELEQQYGENNK